MDEGKAGDIICWDCPKACDKLPHETLLRQPGSTGQDVEHCQEQGAAKWHRLVWEEMAGAMLGSERPECGCAQLLRHWDLGTQPLGGNAVAAWGTPKPSQISPQTSSLSAVCLSVPRYRQGKGL